MLGPNMPLQTLSQLSEPPPCEPSPARPAGSGGHEADEAGDRGQVRPSIDWVTSGCGGLCWLPHSGLRAPAGTATEHSWHLLAGALQGRVWHFYIPKRHPNFNIFDRRE